MDIYSKGKYPSNVLSNFHPHKFIFDGVKCNSIEGVLQSFKFDKIHIQNEVCKLVGLGAKNRGRRRRWHEKQCLYWRGNIYRRNSKEYQNLLTRLYDCVFEQCESFRKALLITKGMTLTHSIGRNNPKETVLTETEFIYQLNRLRSKHFE